MKAFAIRRGEKHGELIGRILCQDIRGVFRKGHLLRAEDIPLLIDASWTELHLLEPGPMTSLSVKQGSVWRRFSRLPGSRSHRPATGTS